MTFPHKSPGASWVALLLAAIFVGVLVAFAPGCGPSRAVTFRQYDHAQAACRDAARDLYAECPSGQQCVERLQALKATCDAELERICDQGVRARRVCRGVR